VLILTQNGDKEMNNYALNSNKDILFFTKYNEQTLVGCTFKIIEKCGDDLKLILQKPPSNKPQNLMDFYKVFLDNDKKLRPNYISICYYDYKLASIQIFDDLLIDDDTLCTVRVVRNTKKMEEEDYE
jgi:hypothetical protein